MDILGFYSRRAVDKKRVGYGAERKRCEEAMEFISQEDERYFVAVSKAVVDRVKEGGLGPVTVEIKPLDRGRAEMKFTHYGAFSSRI